MMNPTLRKVTACVCYTALIVIALGLIFGPLVCFSQVAGRPASETYVAAKLNAHNATNNAHSDIRAQVFAATTNVNALTIAATNATEAAHAATVQANAAILKNTQQDADISYLYASNANTIAIANLANTRAQAANVTNAQNGAAIASVSNLTVTAQATANAAVGGVTAVSNLVIGVKALNENAITNETDLIALRAYHYGSPDIVESPAEWFVFNGAGTITAFNWAAGRTNVVIPCAIGGVPVTTIGANAFRMRGIVSVIAPQTVTMIANTAFSDCAALTSVTIPQVTSIGNSAFADCDLLASVHIGQNAPSGATGVFYGITPPTVYVTDPQATGWGATWNGAPVVRPPLYGSNVTAQAFTLGGDTITEWPSGGGETSIIAPLYESGTNITVTSTQSVYSVSVTDAGPVGIDWSGLALDGTGRAEITLRINVTEWGGTNVTFSPSLTFGQTPEILVTGVWEFAASTIDGVTTRVSQTWPECCGWQPVVITVAGVSLTVGTWWQMTAAATNYVYWQAVNRAGLVRMQLGVINGYAVDVNLYSSYAAAGNTTFSALDVFQSKTLSFPSFSTGDYTVSIAVPQPVQPNRGVKIWVAPVGEVVRISNLKCRDFNANERAAYAAGWRP